jgi:putative membrane-bound dehydrogenase-like protein
MMRLPDNESLHSTDPLMFTQRKTILRRNPTPQPCSLALGWRASTTLTWFLAVAGCLVETRAQQAEQQSSVPKQGDEVAIYDSQEETVPKMTPAEVVQTTRLPEGFRMQVAASEPDVQQPIAMAWDARGKLWIAENYTYAESSKRVDKDLSDRIVLLEDTDQDGVFDKRKIFATGIKGLTSIEVGANGKNYGIWALAPPNLYFYSDANLDDVADGPPVIALQGFNAEIRHNFANGLRFGPDGWLYGRHGILGQSQVIAPNALAPNPKLIFNAAPPQPAAPTPTMLTCGIWRYHPTTGKVEMVCEGTTNPWGMDWDAHGNLFFINTVIGHLWHAIPNAHLQRMYGEDSDPFAYELLPQIADHVHWDATKEDWRETRKGPPSSGTDEAGGGHAHSGLMIYQADQWPQEYRGDAFAINLHGRRINRDRIEKHGAGFTASHGKDMAFWQDLWFRGLDLVQAPDGSVVIIDWSDIGECHDDDGVHRTSGRIYRLSYNNKEQSSFSREQKLLTSLFEQVRTGAGQISSKEVIEIISHRNVWYTQQLLKLLRTRTITLSEPESLLALATKTSKATSTSADSFAVVKQLRSIWTLKAAGLLNAEHLFQVLRSDSHEALHANAAKLLVDGFPSRAKETTSNNAALNNGAAFNNRGSIGIEDEAAPWVVESEAEMLDTLFARGKPSEHLHYSLMLASLLPHFNKEFEPLLTKLLAREELADDLTYNLVLWYGMKDFVAQSPRSASELLLKTRLSKLRELIVRRLSTMIAAKETDAGTATEALSFYFADIIQRDNPALHATAIRGVWGAYQGRSQGTKVPYWDELMKLGSKHSDPAIQRMSVLLGALFDATTPLENLTAISDDKTATLAERKTALEAIGGIDNDKAREKLWEYLQDGELGNAAGYALRRTLDPSRAQPLIERYAVASQPAKQGILAALSSRPETMNTLLEAIEKGSVNKDAIDANTWRQFVLLGDWKLLERARKFNPTLGITEDKQRVIENALKVFTAETIATGNRDRGRALWVQKCGNCHKLFGVGGEIGPELTGAQRSNLRYWLENILAPSNVVAANYRVTMFRTTDGQILTGVAVSQNDREVTLQTAQSRIVIPMIDIESQKPSELSLMPEGLLDPLTDEERADLFNYLMSDPQ